MLKRGMSPSHPGSILSGMIEGFIEESGQHYSISEIAQGLGVTRTTLSAILNKKSGISPSMAIKLSEGFGTSAELWMNLQKRYDLWQAEKTVKRQNIRHFIVNKSSIFNTEKAS